MTDLTALADTLRALLGPDFGIGVTDPRIDYGDLHPSEVAATPRMVPKRRLEFTAGRAAARMAMAELGVDPHPIPMAPDRAPVWPTGLIGSIAHCDTVAIAAVALADQIRAIGIDIEPATPLDPDLWDTVCTGAELEWLNAQPKCDRGLQAKLIFCAKESVYKAQYPLTGRMIGFEDVEVTFSNTAFSAQLNTDQYTGQFAQAAALLLAIVTP